MESGTKLYGRMFLKGTKSTSDKLTNSVVDLCILTFNPEALQNFFIVSSISFHSFKDAFVIINISSTSNLFVIKSNARYPSRDNHKLFLSQTSGL